MKFNRAFMLSLCSTVFLSSPLANAIKFAEIDLNDIDFSTVTKAISYTHAKLKNDASIDIMFSDKTGFFIQVQPRGNTPTKYGYNLQGIDATDLIATLNVMKDDEKSEYLIGDTAAKGLGALMYPKISQTDEKQSIEE